MRLVPGGLSQYSVVHFPYRSQAWSWGGLILLRASMKGRAFPRQPQCQSWVGLGSSPCSLMSTEVPLWWATHISFSPFSPSTVLAPGEHWAHGGHLPPPVLLKPIHFPPSVLLLSVRALTTAIASYWLSLSLCVNLFHFYLLYMVKIQKKKSKQWEVRLPPTYFLNHLVPFPRLWIASCVFFQGHSKHLQEHEYMNSLYLGRHFLIPCRVQGSESSCWDAGEARHRGGTRLFAHCSGSATHPHLCGSHQYKR